MKHRATDDGDRITEQEVMKSRASWFRWAQLWLTNLPAVIKLLMVVITAVGGTVAAPEVYKKVQSYTAASVPVPAGQTLMPQPGTTENVWRGQVDLSLISQTTAIDTNTAAVEALRGEIRELETRLTAQRSRGDGGIKALVDAIAARVAAIEEVVQP